MVAYDNVGAFPVNALFVFYVEKYTADKGAAINNKPPEPVDVFICLLFACQDEQYRP